MNTMKQRWICPNMDVQVFTPQEFVAACESYEQITIETFHPGCRKGSIQCTTGEGQPTSVHFEHSEQIKFIPPTSGGADAVRQYWEDAYELVSESRDFNVYCGDVLKGKAKVIGRGDHGITEVTASNMSVWSSGYCGMQPSDIGNSNSIVVLGAGWDTLKNHS